MGIQFKEDGPKGPGVYMDTGIFSAKLRPEALSDKVFYRCDGCGKTIRGDQIKLVPWTPNVQIFGRCVYVISEQGKIMYTTTNKCKPTDRTINCPFCGRAHLFGIDEVKNG